MKMIDMKTIDKSEECLGRYASKKTASTIAKEETKRTGKKHHVFLTHFHCPYDLVDKMCWTIMVSK